MKKSVTKNFIYNLSYQILILILPFITTPYISRVLGAENIGIYGYTLSISAYFILFGTVGIALYGQREIAYNQNNKKEYTKSFYEIVIFRFITMLISILIFYNTFCVDNQYATYYRILILELVANCFDISWFFMGKEDFKKTVLRNLLVKIISVICIFVFVKNTDDLKAYFLIYVLSILIGNISLWLYLPKYLIKINMRSLNIFKHLKPTISLFIPQIAIQIYTIVDRTMIGSIINEKSEVGYYEQAQKIIKMLLAVITSLGTVMMSRIASTYVVGDKKRVNDYIYKSFNLVFVLAFPLIFGIILISSKFVPLFFGAGYDKVITLMQVISPIILFIGISNVIGTQYLLPTNRQKEFTTSVIIGAGVNIVINLTLIWKFGALGASIGTVIAEMMVCLMQLVFVRKEFKIKKIFMMGIKYFCVSVIMYIICYFVGIKIYSDILSLIIQSVVGVVIYFIGLIIIKDSLIMEIIGKVKNSIGFGKCGN